MFFFLKQDIMFLFWDIYILFFFDLPQFFIFQCFFETSPFHLVFSSETRQILNIRLCLFQWCMHACMHSNSRKRFFLWAFPCYLLKKRCAVRFANNDFRAVALLRTPLYSKETQTRENKIFFQFFFCGVKFGRKW